MSKYIKRHPKFFENIREINGVKEKRCTQCGEWKPETIEYYYMKNKSKPEKGFQSECKECTIKRNSRHQKENYGDKKIYFHENYLNKRDYYFENAYRYKENNLEKVKDDQRRWQQGNPDKIKYYNSLHRVHDISTKEEQAMLKVFNYQCAYCGMPLKEHKKKFSEKLHNDHVDHEGYNDLRNDVPACKPCNCSKHTSIMKEWYEKQNFYSEERYNKIIWWLTEGYKDYIENKPPYKISKSRIYRDDDTYYYQYELWTVDEKRNMIECIAIGKKKKDLNSHINKIMALT